MLVHRISSVPPDELAPTAVDAVVVGGDFYGVRLALLLRGEGAKVLLVEREAELLGRASLLNQARVRTGTTIREAFSPRCVHG